MEQWVGALAREAGPGSVQVWAKQGICRPFAAANYRENRLLRLRASHQSGQKAPDLESGCHPIPSPADAVIMQWARTISLTPWPLGNWDHTMWCASQPPQLPMQKVLFVGWWCSVPSWAQCMMPTLHALQHLVEWQFETHYTGSTWVVTGPLLPFISFRAFGYRKLIIHWLPGRLSAGWKGQWHTGIAPSYASLRTTSYVHLAIYRERMPFLALCV